MDELGDFLNMQLPPGDLLARLILSIVCGGLVGWERERIGKPAGIRTHMLVALGCSLTMALADEIGLTMAAKHPNYNFDPGRVLQGVVTGIGFIGAGVIIHGQHGVRGLTTSAGIWVVGAIGACCGSGYFGLAIIATILAFIVLYIFGLLEAKYGTPEEDHADAGDNKPQNAKGGIKKMGDAPKTDE